MNGTVAPSLYASAPRAFVLLAFMYHGNTVSRKEHKFIENVKNRKWKIQKSNCRLL